MSQVLVAYFSASGVTKKVAEKIAKAAEAEIYEIQPKVIYTTEDLDWKNKESRSSIEMADHGSRPEIVDIDAPVSDAEVVFLGFPIWWYIAPTIVNTFLEKYDFSGKKIVLFATSGGSGFGETVENLKKSVSENTEIVEGKLLNGDPSQEEITAWVKTVL
ncbi:MAG: NAD(P)H-dependent oxidoreductase [Lachnospiraceae bacterium]|nr:NAD(P)H-dependent oxidoreductase [Lachnospiraceae bacterium]